MCDVPSRHTPSRPISIILTICPTERSPSATDAAEAIETRAQMSGRRPAPPLAAGSFVVVVVVDVVVSVVEVVVVVGGRQAADDDGHR